jgi:hypothetical protein
VLARFDGRIASHGIAAAAVAALQDLGATWTHAPYHPHPDRCATTTHVTKRPRSGFVQPLPVLGRSIDCALRVQCPLHHLGADNIATQVFVIRVRQKLCASWRS